jgi:cytidylate kinase
MNNPFPGKSDIARKMAEEQGLSILEIKTVPEEHSALLKDKEILTVEEDIEQTRIINLTGLFPEVEEVE